MNERLPPSTVAGPLMIDVEGESLTSDDRDRLSHPLVGAVILFARNYRDSNQLRSLVGEIKSLPRPELLVAVDQEGGRVQRFIEGFTRLPPAYVIGQIYDKSAERGRRAAFASGRIMAKEVLDVGVDLSFAPVVDLYREASQAIGNRAFHDQPEAVADLALAYVNGMRSAGMKAVAKHFPGHGGVEADSHLVVPVDDRGFSELRANDLVPFRRLIHGGLGAILTCHVRFPETDQALPTFSTTWLQKILREELAFGGAVFSDDLGMQAAFDVPDPTERCETALTAGCDMVLLCNRPQEVDAVLSQLRYEWPPDSGRRLGGVFPFRSTNKPNLFDDRRLCAELGALRLEGAA